MTAIPSPLLTDLYQLTMIAAYVDSGKADDTATFDLFIRRYPKDWGYLIANGVEEAIDIATGLRFGDEDIAYLRGTGLFQERHLDYFKSFRFTGDIAAVAEGSVIAANTPLLRITAPRAQAQLLETILLDTIGYQTMIATKASRTVDAAQGKRVVEFGLRRAQGQEAGLKGSRAAYLGGCAATSNVQAGKEYGIPITGTHAHSFVMSFGTEEEAFRAYVRTFPNQTTLLVDTYDTHAGVRTAIAVGKELERAGKRLGAVRLDSGDLEQLARDARTELDDAEMQYVRIIASGDLNEHKVADLVERGAPIDAFGVGTELITGKPDAALSAVYKLAEDPDGAKLKLAQGKRTWPGKKQVWRVLDQDGRFLRDVLALEGETVLGGVPLLETVVKDGERRYAARTLGRARTLARESRTALPEECRQVKNPRPYEMRPSVGLTRLADTLAREHEPTQEACTPQERLASTIDRWKEVAV